MCVCLCVCEFMHASVCGISLAEFPNIPNIVYIIPVIVTSNFCMHAAFIEKLYYIPIQSNHKVSRYPRARSEDRTNAYKPRHTIRGLVIEVGPGSCWESITIISQ